MSLEDLKMHSILLPDAVFFDHNNNVKVKLLSQSESK